MSTMIERPPSTLDELLAAEEKMSTMIEQPASRLMSEQDELAIVKIDQIAKDTQIGIARAEESGSGTLKAIVLAKGMQAIRQALTPAVLKDVMALQGSPLGFRTDRDTAKDGNYSEAVVRDCIIEATLRGVRLIGNEFNIIAGRLYITKEGYERLVREWPGISDIEIVVDVPEFITRVEMKKGKEGKEYPKEVTYAYCSCSATWRIGSREYEIIRQKTPTRDLRIVVSVYGEAHDAAIGKCKSKLYRLIAERLYGIGSEMIDDPDPVDEPPADSPVLEMPALDAWGEHAEAIAEAIEQATDREQLEKIYRQWAAYASNADRQAQLANVCSVKAAVLKEHQ